MSTKFLKRVALTKDFLICMFFLVFAKCFPNLRLVRKDLTGKTAIITGGNSGIGLWLAQEMARMHCSVYLACRSADKGSAAVKHIKANVPGADVYIMELDTSSLTSVTSFAKVWDNKRLDYLFHNAGICGPPSSEQRFTADGLEMTYQTNFLGSYLLTHLLEPCLSASARVIFTSSTAIYRSGFSNTFSTRSVRNTEEPGFHIPHANHRPNSAYYAQTKFMQAAFARALQRRFDEQAARSNDTLRERRTAFSFTPGVTSTPIFGKMDLETLRHDPIFWFLTVTADAIATPVSEGSATGVYLALDDDVTQYGNAGGFYDRMMRRTCPADLASEELLDRLCTRWENDAGIKWKVVHDIAKYCDACMGKITKE